MRTDVRDVADPGVVRRYHNELLLQPVWCVNACCPGSLSRPTVANLGTEPRSSHQSINPILTATLTDVLKIRMDLAVAIHATAFQPELLNQPRQPLIDF
jgi:hypothetical protein